jgi:hypothetical protein
METGQNNSSAPERPHIAAFVVVSDTDKHLLSVALHDLRHQRDVRLDIIVLDRTTDGGLPEGEHTVVRLGPDATVGDAHRAGLNHTRASFIAWHVLGVRNLPNRIHIQWTHLIANRDISMITTNLVLTDESGRIVALANPAEAGDAPTPLWQGGVLLRRAALARIGRSADLPVQLFLLMRLRAHDRVLHVAEPLCVAQESDFSALRRKSLDEAMAIKRINPPVAPRAEISVVVAVNGSPSGVRRLLASLAVQDIDPVRFELCLIDAGTSPNLTELLQGVELPYRFRLYDVGDCGLAAARNIGIQAARGDLIVFFDGRTTLEPDNLGRHLSRHKKSSAARSVMGPVVLQSAGINSSLTLLSETTSVASLCPEMRPGESYRGQAFTSSNLSIPRAALLRIGGFDASFSGQGAEDLELGMRLERALGMSIVFDPDVRATRLQPIALGELIARQRALGWCTQRMARKHDDPSILLGGQTEQSLDNFWSGVESALAKSGDERETLSTQVMALCAREDSHGQGPRFVDEVRPMLERLCALEFGRGLLAARKGVSITALVA